MIEWDDSLFAFRRRPGKGRKGSKGNSKGRGKGRKGSKGSRSRFAKGASAYEESSFAFKGKSKGKGKKPSRPGVRREMSPNTRKRLSGDESKGIKNANRYKCFDCESEFHLAGDQIEHHT